MEIVNKIKQVLGLESLQEKLDRYTEISKSYKEVESELDQLSKTFFIEKSRYIKRLAEPENEEIQDRIKDKWNKFLEYQREDIRKSKKKFDSLRKEKEKIESDERIQKALKEISKSEQYEKLKKAYQNQQISPETYNTIIKALTDSKKVKYADFILFNEDGKLLLLKRSAWEDDNKGAWVIPGGHVDPGEDFETAAKRELREESGYNVDKCENVGSYEDDKCHIEYFQSHINTKEQQMVLDVFESRDYRWINLDELDEYEMVFNMKDNLMKILKLPNKQKEIIRKSNSELKKAILNNLIPLEQIIEKAKSGVYKNTPENRKLGRVGQKYGDKKEEQDYLTRVKQYAEQIITGQHSLKRLSPEEEQGRLLGGKRNVEASIIVGTESSSGDVIKKGSEVDLLTKYAKNENIWFNKDYFDKLVFLDQGGEAKVWELDKDNVIKVNHFPFEEKPSKFLDRVSIHNYLFPESRYKVLGFTSFDESGFSVVLEQPFIEHSGNPVTQKEVEKDLNDRGLSYNKDTDMFMNDDYIIGDTHQGNVLRSKNRNLIYIDPIIELNTPEAGYGGNRKLGEINLPVEKSFEDELQKAYLLGIISEDVIEKAWKKHPIGTIITRKDGQKYKKVSETGNSAQDWKLVSKDKARSGEGAGTEEREHKPEELKEQAKNTSETALQNAIKQSDDPKVRQAAHEELDRREKEEKPQEEKEVKNEDSSDVKENEAKQKKRIKEKVEELSDKYRDLMTEAMNDDFKDPTKTDNNAKLQKEYSRYISRVKEFDGVNKEEHLKAAQELLGLESEKEVKDFFGDGDILGIAVEDEFVSVLTEDMYCQRGFSNGTVDMLEFILNPDLDKGQGKGSDIFYNQVQSFKNKGFKKIDTDAVRSDVYNGYYTWARLGYSIGKKEHRTRFFNLLSTSEDAQILSVSSIQELMSFKKGRDFWVENGFSFYGTFDLSDNSRSMFILNKYMEEKKNAKK